MRTLFIGQTVIHLDSVDSTNNFAANLLSTTNVVEGTVILTDCQKNGRGQRGAEWVSRAGENLTISVVFNPVFLSPKYHFTLNQVVSLAIVDTLEEYGIADVAVKWPNDIYVGGEKIAGILIENTLAENRLKSSIVGVGLNVNQAEFPEMILATSMKMNSGKVFDLEAVLESLCQKLEYWYLLLRRGGSEQLDKAYTEKMLGIGTTRNFLFNGEEISAKVDGVDDFGRLLLKTEDKELLVISVKEVVWI